MLHHEREGGEKPWEGTYRMPDPAEGPSILVLDCRIDPGELARLIRLTFGDRIGAITVALTGEGEPLP
jgi:hypothetical protein